jgi:hypothetical protein
VLNHPAFQTGGDGLMFITFDVCDAAAGGDCNGDQERVFTPVIGPKVKPSTKSNMFYWHESTLPTILDVFGIEIILAPPPPRRCGTFLIHSTIVGGAYASVFRNGIKAVSYKGPRCGLEEEHVGDVVHRV